MKSFKQFISEFEVDDEDFDKFYRNCSVYFTYCDKDNYRNVFYRGVKSQAQYKVDTFRPFERNVTSGRKPTDSSEDAHEIANDYFAEMFRYPYRSGLMVSGSEEQAREYLHAGGNPIIIVPMNGYSLCYSDKVRDFYGDVAYGSEVDYNGNWDSKNFAKSIVDKLKEANYKSGPEYTKDACKSKNEIMLYPTNFSYLECYAFSLTFWTSKMIPKLMEKN